MKNTLTNIMMAAIMEAAHTNNRDTRKKIWVTMIGDLIGLRNAEAKEDWKNIKSSDAQDKVATTLEFITFDEFVKCAEKSSQSIKH